MEQFNSSTVFAAPGETVPEVASESWPVPTVFASLTAEEQSGAPADEADWTETSEASPWTQSTEAPPWAQSSEASPWTQSSAAPAWEEAVEETEATVGREGEDEAGIGDESELDLLLAAEPELPELEGEGFESGLVLVEHPGAEAKGQEHWDPNNTGVPLYDTGPDVRTKRLSRNFTVAELASSGGRTDSRARISAELVQALQAIRDRAGKAVKITSGYRSWQRNVDVYRNSGKPPTKSRHCSGQAADIKISGMSGMQIAKLALDAYGDGIGVGIGGTFAHIDVRGKWAKWTYFSGDKNKQALAEIESYRRRRNATPPASPRTVPNQPPKTQSLDGQQGEIAPGRLVVQRLAQLAVHAGTSPDLVLKWNRMVQPSAIDVVVHLHGYSASGHALNIATEKEPISGLDFTDPDRPGPGGRTRATLLVLPRGNHDPQTSAGRNNQRFTFPALLKAGGLEQLVQGALAQFTAATGASVTLDRLIVTAHSGGGAALMALLDHNNPHEIFTFDALYNDPARLIAWAQRRMASGTGALRVLYRPGEQTAHNSEKVASAIRSVNSPSFRVETTRVSHLDIPRRFGWRLLTDASADLPGATQAVAAAPAREASEEEEAPLGWSTELDPAPEALAVSEWESPDEALDEAPYLAEADYLEHAAATEELGGVEEAEAGTESEAPAVPGTGLLALSEAPSGTSATCGALRGDEPKFRLGTASTPGGVAEPRTTADPRVYGVQLWDYKVNDYSLRVRHLEALRLLVAKIAADVRSGRFADGGWKISVDGFASRTGNYDHNLSLSFWRMTTVARCLECMLGQVGIPPGRVTMGDQRGLGYQDAVPNVEDPRRRLVQVTVHPPGLKPPPVRPPSDRFEICFTSLDTQVQALPIPGTFNMLGVARTKATYQIRDAQTRATQAYSYTGLGFMLQVPLDKVLPAKVRQQIPKPLLDMIGKLLARIVPGGGKPGTGACTPFGVAVFPTPDPVRMPPPAIGVRSFAGPVDLMVPAPGLGNVQIRFDNSIFRFHAKAVIKPDPLEVDVARTLTARAIVGTQGTATLVGALSREDSAEGEAGLDSLEIEAGLEIAAMQAT